MAATRQFENLKRDLSRPLFNVLLTDELENQAVALRALLNDKESSQPLNPGRPLAVTWHSQEAHNEKEVLSENLKDILILSVIFDQAYASLYAEKTAALHTAIANLNHLDYNIVRHELSLADELLVEHIKRELPELQYHREPHPNESAVLAQKLIISHCTGEASTPAEQAITASAFAVHDAVYDEPADGIN